ncbi:MAG: tRNA 2-thiouridine(34) synthase MnmA, partial [Thermotoga sp.]
MKVGIALSGGVDSAVALYQLLEEGHEVKAYHMKTLKDEFFAKKTIKKKICCSPSDTMDAIKIAKKLGVELEIVDLSDSFKELIVRRFKDDLLKGLTPNPCVHCNRLIKFGILMDRALEDGMKLFASGHFARIVYSEKYGKKMIAKAKDQKKDQSYFLALLSPERIDKLVFPNGNSTKEENRELAERIELHVSAKPESQDVCFIPDGKIESFLE